LEIFTASLKPRTREKDSARHTGESKSYLVTLEVRKETEDRSPPVPSNILNKGREKFFQIIRFYIHHKSELAD